MADTVTVDDKELDKSDVKNMSDDDFAHLMARVRGQAYDDQELIDTLHAWRGSKAAAEATAATTVPDGTVEEVLDWVGDDDGKAQLALDAENDKDSPRKTLVEALEELV